MNRIDRLIRAIAPLCLLLIAPLCVPAQIPEGWKFTCVLPSPFVTIPGGEKVFTRGIAASENSLVFVGYKSSKPEDAFGVYRLEGSLVTKIVDTRSLLPKSRERFHSFETTVFASGDQVAFEGASKGNGNRGLFLSRKGKLETVADTRTMLPGSAEKLNRIHLMSNSNNLNANHLVFGASGEKVSGIYSREKNGSLIRVVDSTMRVPGTKTRFRSVGNAQLSGDRIAFMNNGNDETRGLYLYDHGVISVIANKKTRVPGKSVRFQNVGEFALSEKRLVFLGRYEEKGVFHHEIFEITPKGPVLLVDMSPFVPPGADYTYEPCFPVAGGETLAFMGRQVSVGGGSGYPPVLFVNRGGVTRQILKVGGKIEGKKIELISLEPSAEGRLMLWLLFTDKKSGGYYLAEFGDQASNSMKN